MIATTKKLPLLLCLTTLFLASEVEAQSISLPRFEDYRVAKHYKGKPAPVDLRSHPKASRFRTMLREGAKHGPNFSGHYTVIMWGCGSDCMQVAIVNAKTGRVYFAPFTVTPSMRADYRINSRLLVQNPPERNERPIDEDMLDVYKPGWYVWKGDRFVKLPIRIRYKRPQ